MMLRLVEHLQFDLLMSGNENSKKNENRQKKKDNKKTTFGGGSFAEWSNSGGATIVTECFAFFL
jgi:hypothetical protein